MRGSAQKTSSNRCHYPDEEIFFVKGENLMQIRRISMDDLPVIGELWLEMTRELGETVPELKVLSPESVDEFTGFVGTSLLTGAGFGFLADANGVEGFVLGQVKTALPPYPAVAFGYITALYVRPEGRRQGLGRALLRSLGECLRQTGVRDLELHVHAGNPGALAFWTNLGFLPLGFRLGRTLPSSVLDWDTKESRTNGG